MQDEDHAFADELKAAAVRELFEEAGILLVGGATDVDCARVRDAISGGSTFGAAVRMLGLELDFGGLVMFTRWVTPALLRRRFDARFYLARLPASQSIQPQEGEVVDWLWVSPAQALADPRITLVYATQAVLESIADAPDVDSLLARYRLLNEVPVIEPRIVRTESGWEVVRD